MIKQAVCPVFNTMFRLARVCLAALLCLEFPLALAEIRVSDDAGRLLVLEQPARRIVSLAPHVTELLFAAGAGKAVVGVSEYSDYPSQAQGIPRVGGGGGLDVEAIVALEPDLVIGWQTGNPALQLERLRTLGLPLFISEPRRLGDIPAALGKFAQLAGTEAAARPQIDAFVQRHAALQASHADSRTVSVYYQIWDRPLMTVNGRHLINDVIVLCGGRNVFAELPELAPQISVEAVLARDPQVIIVAGQAAEVEEAVALADWRRWSRLQAVRERHLYVVERDLMVRHTPRILDGAEQLCEILDRVRIDTL